MQKPLKHLVIIVMVLGIISLVANVLVDNPYTHRLIRTALNKSVKAETNLIVDFKAIKVSVVPPGIDLYGVHVAPQVTPDRPLFTTAQFKVRISIWALILGDIRIGLIEAQEPTVIWPPPPAFPGFLKHPLEEQPKVKKDFTWPPMAGFPVDRILLNQAKVAVSLPLATPAETANSQSADASDLDTTIEGMDLDFTWKSWERMALKLNVKAMNLSHGSVSFLEETSLATNWEWRGHTLSLTSLTTAGERLSIESGQGSLVLEHAPSSSTIDRLTLKASTALEGNLSILGSFLDFGDTQGRIKGKVDSQVSIPLTSKEEVLFKVTGEAQAQDAKLFDFRLFDSKVRFEVDPKAISFPELDVMIDQTSYAKGRGILRFDDALSFEWYARPNKLRLHDLLDSLGVSFGYLDGALISDDVKIIGKGDPFAMKVSAHAQVSDLLLPETPYDHRGFPVPPQCRINLDLAINDQGLQFDGTSGLCFQTKETTSPSIPKAPLAAPPEAFAVSPITISGGVHFEKGLNLSLFSPALDLTLGQHFATIPMGGKALMRTEIKGPFDRVHISSHFESHDVMVLDMPLGHLKGSTLVDADRLLWKNVSIQPGDASESFSSDGSLDFDEDLTLRTRFKAGSIKSEDLGKILRSGLPDMGLSMGLHRLSGDLAGPLLSPFAMQGRIMFDAFQLMQGEHLLADRLHMQVDSKEKYLKWDDVRAQLGGLTLGASLHITRSRPHHLSDVESSDLWTRLGLLPSDKVDASVFTIKESQREKKSKKTREELRENHISQLPYLKSYMTKAGIKGAIDFKAKLSGPFQGPYQGTFEGGVSQAELLGSRLAPVGVKGFIQDSKLDLMINHSGNALEGRMSIDWQAKNLPYNWFFSMHRLDLRALGTRYFYDDPRNYLYLTADWQMQGQLTNFWKSNGELSIKGIRGKFVRDLHAQTKTMTLTQEKPVTLKITPEEWKFDQDEPLKLTGKYLNLGITTAKGCHPENLGFEINGLLDLTIAKELSSEIDNAEGQLDISGTIKGSIDDPKLTFDVIDQKPSAFTAGTWRPVIFGFAAMRPALRNIKIAAHYEHGRVNISNFIADKGSGTVSASGSLGIAEESDEGSRLDITLSNASLIYTVAFLRSFETQLSGNIALSGHGFPYKISGGIDITKARSTKEVDIRDEIINMVRQKSFSTQVVQDKPMFLFDLRVNADQTIHVTNRYLQSVLSTNLTVQGSDINPQVLGQLEVNKGRFTYKRDFQILRGLVIFDDPVKPDPSLDILAAAEVDTYRVYITITGRTSNPTVEFSIDPPTRENGAPINKLEILVLLSRGKLPEENRSLGQETQSAAASEAANLILGQFEEPVEKLFDLSGQNVVRHVYIDTHPSPDGGPVPRLNLPLDIGEDFDVVFRADGQTNEVSTEYNVHDNINFSGVLERRRADDQALQTRRQGADFEAKVNLKFRFSFD